MTSLTASIRVLLVEDNSADLALVQACLKDYGHPHIDLTTVTRLADALDALKRTSFHVVISDLNLPDNEGLQTFLKLKQASPDSAFVVMTGMDDRDTCMQAVRAGAQDYLVKGEAGPRRIWQSVSNAIVRQGILRQVSSSAKELGEFNSRLQELARIDPLTGLYNRRGFDERLAREASRPRYRDAANAVLLLDIDNFKQINDRMGHDQGDLALLEVTRRLRGALRPADIAGRVGGDEFMVLLPETSRAEAAEIAERVRRSVDEKPVPSPSGGFNITVSVGVARQTSGVETAHDLLANADQALTASKQGGKNQVSLDFFEAGPATPETAEAKILMRPFFRITDGAVTGYEFLCQSLPDAETSRRGNPARAPRALHAFRHCALAAARIPKGLECHIRLHCTDLIGVEAGELLEQLPRGLDPSLVSLEIRDLARAPLAMPLTPLLRSLLEAGIRPVLHDTDLLQNTMSALLLLEAGWVKVGRGWFRGVAADPFKENSVRRLLRIVESLGARAIACGVQNMEDLDVLQQLNVLHGQGPLWRRHP
ncbi:MAG TPA: diguanylate cyclase [bacterium]|jgi:two-component system cell cycle response regulator|nr:diguanylate cyclase [bacterium]